MDINKIRSRVEDFFHGQYIVEDFVGEGAFAEVFLVRHVFLDDLRVMKIIKEPIISHERLDAIFHEVKIASPLKHENIIEIHDAGIIPANDEFNNEFVYFIMEYVPSGDLFQYSISFIKSKRQVPIYWVLILIKQITFGLNVLHSSTPVIVHGDLKPSNILLSFNSQDHVVVKLTDFGFSKEIYSNSSKLSIGGTRPFMAPESFKKEFYPQTDIYAVGVIFYLFLTNHLPVNFMNCSLDEVLEGKPWRKEIIAPSELNPKIPKIIDEIVLKCLSFDIKDRYENAKELYNSLEKCLENFAVFDKKMYIMNKDVIKAFRLAKYENKLSEAIELLEKYDMAMMFEGAIESTKFTLYKSDSLKNFSDMLGNEGQLESNFSTFKIEDNLNIKNEK